MQTEKTFTTIAKNPLKTREDLISALEQLTDPLRPLYSRGGARLAIGGTGASYPAATAEMEGFSRVLWGLVPLLMGGGESGLWDTVLDGIRHGTDPAHEEYWGVVQDYDQRLVEMAVFGFALAAIPEQIWSPLTQKEQEQLYSWLNQINSHPCYDCNWLFFNVLVNVGFRRVGCPYDAEQLENNLKRMDDFYLGDGWYSDGINGHSDYYVPFAIHYYALLYAKLMEQEDPERSQVFKERARLFATEFLGWFAPDGSALPYGRSLSYRFAQSAFWGALVYAGVEVFPVGVVKGLVLRNLRWWFSQPIFDAGGVLTIGYTYPNLVMAENYNAPGSSYWALKTFLPLALSAEHPFWKEEELPLPDIPAVIVQKPAHLVIVREPASGHVAAFNSGHLYTNEHTHTSAKYEKFVYSTGFDSVCPAPNGDCLKGHLIPCSLWRRAGTTCIGSDGGIWSQELWIMCCTPSGSHGLMLRFGPGSLLGCPGIFGYTGSRPDDRWTPQRAASRLVRKRGGTADRSYNRGSIYSMGNKRSQGVDRLRKG